MGAYFGKEIAQAEREGRIRDLHYDPELPVHTSWDLGIGDPTAIWFWQITDNEIRLIDHYENYRASHSALRKGNTVTELQAGR